MIKRSKESIKNIKQKSPSKRRRSYKDISDISLEMNIRENEKAVDTVSLNTDVPESFRDSFSGEISEAKPDTSVNSSQAEDRGEDLVEDKDPFIQQPDLNNQVPAELDQERGYLLNEQKETNPEGDLADSFEADREHLEGRSTRHKKK